MGLLKGDTRSLDSSSHGSRRRACGLLPALGLFLGGATCHPQMVYIGDNGKDNGNYYSILGLCGLMENRMETTIVDTLNPKP